MANVTHYSILFYGSADGYQGNRAQIQLADGATVLGWVRFHDGNMPFPVDSQSGDKIVMHLPSAMFGSVLDVLRNEKPIKYYFVSGRAFLGTDAEEVGEEE
jgi:hypothetical protein